MAICTREIPGSSTSTAHARVGKSTYGFASVVGTGTVSIVESGPEKLRALRLLMEHYTQKSDWEFDEKAVSAVAILKLTVGSLCCKVHE